ncbi:MAG: hypothetical protein LM523_03545 [Candidatus Contendobacter sp.]|nr:hypothetical protein [Candidatus Contendobacter sp.]
MRELEIAALEQAGWVQAKAARLLGMTPRQIVYRVQILNIKMRRQFARHFVQRCRKDIEEWQDRCLFLRVLELTYTAYDMRYWARFRL